MLNHLKKALGLAAETEPAPPRGERATAVGSVLPVSQPEKREEPEDGYFPTMVAMLEAVTRRDYARATELVYRNLNDGAPRWWDKPGGPAAPAAPDIPRNVMNA